MNDKQTLIKLSKAHTRIRRRVVVLLATTLANTLTIVLLVCLLLVSGCVKRDRSISEALYYMGDQIDYRGIRIEDRTNKVKSEMDK